MTRRSGRGGEGEGLKWKLSHSNAGPARAGGNNKHGAKLLLSKDDGSSSRRGAGSPPWLLVFPLLVSSIVFMPLPLPSTTSNNIKSSASVIVHAKSDLPRRPPWRGGSTTTTTTTSRTNTVPPKFMAAEDPTRKSASLPSQEADGKDDDTALLDEYIDFLVAAEEGEVSESENPIRKHYGLLYDPDQQHTTRTESSSSERILDVTIAADNAEDENEDEDWLSESSESSTAEELLEDDEEKDEDEETVDLDMAVGTNNDWPRVSTETTEKEEQILPIQQDRSGLIPSSSENQQDIPYEPMTPLPPSEEVGNSLPEHSDANLAANDAGEDITVQKGNTSHDASQQQEDDSTSEHVSLHEEQFLDEDPEGSTTGSVLHQQQELEAEALALEKEEKEERNADEEGEDQPTLLEESFILGPSAKDRVPAVADQEPGSDNMADQEVPSHDTNFKAKNSERDDSSPSTLWKIFSAKINSFLVADRKTSSILDAFYAGTKQGGGIAFKVATEADMDAKQKSSAPSSLEEPLRIMANTAAVSASNLVLDEEYSQQSDHHSNDEVSMEDVPVDETGDTLQHAETANKISLKPFQDFSTAPVDTSSATAAAVSASNLLLKKYYPNVYHGPSHASASETDGRQTVSDEKDCTNGVTQLCFKAWGAAKSIASMKRKDDRKASQSIVSSSSVVADNKECDAVSGPKNAVDNTKEQSNRAWGFVDMYFQGTLNKLWASSSPKQTEAVSEKLQDLRKCPSVEMPCSLPKIPRSQENETFNEDVASNNDAPRTVRGAMSYFGSIGYSDIRSSFSKNDMVEKDITKEGRLSRGIDEDGAFAVEHDTFGEDAVSPNKTSEALEYSPSEFEEQARLESDERVQSHADTAFTNQSLDAVAAENEEFEITDAATEEVTCCEPISANTGLSDRERNSDSVDFETEADAALFDGESEIDALEDEDTIQKLVQREGEEEESDERRKLQKSKTRLATNLPIEDKNKSEMTQLNFFYRFLLAHGQERAIMFFTLVFEMIRIYVLCPMIEALGQLLGDHKPQRLFRTSLPEHLLLTRGGAASESEGGTEDSGEVEDAELSSPDDNSIESSCPDAVSTKDDSNEIEAVGSQLTPGQAKPSNTPRFRPNRLYRFFLRQGRVGHILVMESMLAVCWSKTYFPTIVTFVELFRRSLLSKRRLSDFEEDYAVASQTTGFVDAEGSSVRGGKRRKAQTKKADQKAIQQLKRIGDVKQAKYRYLSESFLKRHEMGAYAAADGISVGMNKFAEEVLASAAEKEAEESDAEWIVEALTSEKPKPRRRGSSLKPSLDVSLTSSSVSVGVEFGLGEIPSKKIKRTSVSDVARQMSTPTKRQVRQQKSDKESGVIGKIRAVGANSAVGRSILGAYPGDVPSPEEAASTSGLTDMARRYGYGEWSEEDDDDDDGNDAKRTKRRKRIRSDHRENRVKQSSDHLVPSSGRKKVRKRRSPPPAQTDDHLSDYAPEIHEFKIPATKTKTVKKQKKRKTSSSLTFGLESDLQNSTKTVVSRRRTPSTRSTATQVQDGITKMKKNQNVSKANLQSFKESLDTKKKESMKQTIAASHSKKVQDGIEKLKERQNASKVKQSPDAKKTEVIAKTSIEKTSSKVPGNHNSQDEENRKNIEPQNDDET